MFVHTNIGSVSDCAGGMDKFNRYIEKSGMEKKTYQYEGVKWLLQNELRVDDVRGGFVADEMGLGKTIMMIGICLANFIPKHKTLIVVPPVLIDQWFAQIYRTTGHKCFIYHGDNKKTIDTAFMGGEGGGVGGVGGNVVGRFERSVIVLCSYDAISIFNNKKKNKKLGGEGGGRGGGGGGVSHKTVDNSFLHRIKWGRVIFDEAHHLRNKNTSRYFGAKLLQSDIKWLVSGTPVQNKKQDFYALCSLINLPASYYTNPDNLIELARKFILKRTKKQVGINLIDAVESKKVVSWTNKDEFKLSEEIHSLIGLMNVKLRENKGTVAGRDLLSLLLRARQSCIYPKMMEKSFESLKKFGIGIGGGGGEGVGEGVCGFGAEAMKASSKLDSVVGTILERKDNGNGKLVFCHFKEEMNEIAERLRKDGLNVGILDGATTKGARGKMLNDKKDVLILQIQTGCEGLNLQDNYSEVYFVSPHWNPYVEDQAVARCHRIGQTKPVFVWRFEMNNFGSYNSNAMGVENVSAVGEVIRDTKNLEEYAMDIQNRKRLLVSNIIE
jgi:SNF2 family DNA or RNA helicase